MARKYEGVRKLPSGRFQARYEHPVTKVLHSAGTFASAADAKDARNFELAKIAHGGWVDPLGPKTTFEAWSQQWSELRRGGNTKTQSFLRSRLVPWWGERKIGDITPLDVQKWINLLIADGLSPATIGSLYSCFRQIMQSAVDHDLLVKTPCRNVTLPTQRRHQPTPVSVADLLALEELAPDRYRAMVHLGGWAGLRWQEAAALRWVNVDLENGLLRICEAVKVGGSVGPTKSDRERVVPIGTRAVEVLRAHRRDYGRTDLLFTTTGHKGVCKLLEYGNFRREVWLPLVRAAGLDPAPTWHDLRHSYATHMRRAGLDPQTLTDNMGHARMSFTADMYGWSRDDRRAETIAAIEAAMKIEMEEKA